MTVQTKEVIEERINIATKGSKIAVFKLPPFGRMDTDKKKFKRFSYKKEDIAQYFDGVFASTVMTNRYIDQGFNEDGGELIGVYTWEQKDDFTQDIFSFQMGCVTLGGSNE